jgi:hypothetical protein
MQTIKCLIWKLQRYSNLQRSSPKAQGIAWNAADKAPGVFEHTPDTVVKVRPIVSPALLWCGTVSEFHAEGRRVSSSLARRWQRELLHQSRCNRDPGGSQLRPRISGRDSQGDVQGSSRGVALGCVAGRHAIPYACSAAVRTLWPLSRTKKERAECFSTG